MKLSLYFYLNKIYMIKPKLEMVILPLKCIVKCGSRQKRNLNFKFIIN